MFYHFFGNPSLSSIGAGRGLRRCRAAAYSIIASTGIIPTAAVSCVCVVAGASVAVRAAIAGVLAGIGVAVVLICVGRAFSVACIRVFARPAI
jgi:hypothetical protein